ncbi:aldehyde reductase II [Aspergillus nomiae NRRL 13137]|uniref:Aldehyde reductase II n=1 Tax=Aspergillus nomiae NRRL (strain ATCC 15546 / NRRL 13137 / CBS 260.88 / M93) TaxID=1509407 RepID=A0A0L1IZM2_ASPN3|nr:aldehyde reductase II [Aspergillus nomiae NRRL 13137]KNG84875.1 aldehyde reductase II [Aspergillus nomiae NRRL 13137]
MSSTDLAIPKGSLVVVTGANGYIASHVVDQLLQHGYEVRGTVRNAEKDSWLNDYFGTKSKRFSLAEVPDISHDGAFDEVVKGAAGIVHVAAPVRQFHDPNIAVPMAVNGTINILASAAAEPSVQRVVITSSSTAAASPQPNKIFSIDKTTWNEAAVKAAWAPPLYKGFQRLLDVYSASKTQAERAAWKFMEDKPPFVLNTVLSNVNMGTILSPENQGYRSSSGWIKAVWDGFPGEGELQHNPPQYYIDVQDNARVHVAALIYPDVQNERLFAFAHPYTWNDILAVLRRLYPQRKFVKDIPNIGEDMSKVANQRAEELLKRISGLPGWTSLEQSIQNATKAWV